MTGFLHGLPAFYLGLLTHLWQCTLILLPILLLAAGLRRAPARLSQLVWSAALLKLFLPLALFGSLARGFAALLLGEQRSAAVAGALPVLPEIRLLLDPVDAVLPATLAPVWLPWLLLGLSLAWGLGAGLLLGRVSRDLSRGSKGASRCAIALCPTLAAKLERCAAAADLPLDALRVLRDPLMPCVIGLWRPRVVLPESLLVTLSEGELVAVLLHEDAHRRRRDPLAMLIQRAAAALLFFYPPVWFLLRRLRESAEYACDEGVLAAGVGSATHRRALGRSLDLQLFSPLPASTALGGERSLLGRRLHRLAHHGSIAMLNRHRLFVACALLLVAAGSFLPFQAVLSETETEAPTAPAEPAPPAAPAEPAPPAAPRAPAPPAALEGADEAKMKLLDVDTHPRPIHMERPQYPAAMREAGETGTAIIEVYINTQGLVDSCSICEGSHAAQELVEAALAAAMKWTFEPAIKDGEAVYSMVAIPFQFALDGKDNGGKEEGSSQAPKASKDE